jgi:hypothetical protein
MATVRGTAVALFLAVAGKRKNKKWRWSMKFQKIIRVQMMLVGMAGVLLLANSAKAQQDMDPTFFDDTPGTPQVQRAAVVPPGQEVQATGAMNPGAAAPLAALEVEASAFTPLDENATIFLIVGIGSVVLLGMAEAIRGNRRRVYKERYTHGFPSSATTN